MVLRGALLTDTQALAELESGLFPENNLNETTLVGVVQHRTSWVVCVDYIIVGYLLGQADYDGLLDILRLGVIPQLRGKGLGTRLLERAAREFPDRMLTVRKDNERAFRIYQQRGFQIVGEFNDPEAWVMRATAPKTL